MKKKTALWGAALCASLQLTACASTVATATAPELPETPYEAVPYNLYPAPESAFVGDVMPFVADGKLELYYLYDTNHNGQAYHPIYRYTTENLYNYADDGQVLGCGNFDERDLALGTGSVFKGQDGLYHCFYTGHNDSMGALGKGKECIMHAISEDRVNWTKCPNELLLPAQNYSADDFRDPFVFWNEDEQCYWMLVAARENSLGGVVAKYTSTNLTDWALCDPLYAPQNQYMLECPDLFKMGETYYLFYSWDCVTYYAMSDSIEGPFVAPPDNVLDGSGFTYYAAKTAELDGVRYLCGWIGRTDQKKDTGTYNWAGNLLIHQLVQKADGTLGVCEPETLQHYFIQEKPYAIRMTQGKGEMTADSCVLQAENGGLAVADLGTRAPTVQLDCDVTFDENGQVGFAFGAADDPAAGAALVLDGKNGCLHYEGTQLAEIATAEPEILTQFNFEPGAPHHVRLVVENEIVILYLDNAKALSSRIYSSVDGAHISIFAQDCEATFYNVSMMTP